MKKVLLATSALVASAGIASADITLTGGADFGIKDSGVASTNAYVHSEIDINIVASATTDNGYTIGASMDIDDGSAETTGLGSVSDPEVFISGAFGTITTGDVAPAADKHGVATVGFDGIGVDTDIEALDTRGTADINYSTTVNNMAITLSYNMGQSATADGDEGDWGMFVSFDAGNGFGVTASYAVDDSAAAAADAAYALGLSYDLEGIALNAYFADNETNGGSAFSASYALDANTTISAVYASTDVSGDESDFGIGFKTNLGGGVSLAGGIGEVDNNTVTDLGFNVAF
jgi:outer membrane protein OmpU